MGRGSVPGGFGAERRAPCVRVYFYFLGFRV